MGVVVIVGYTSSMSETVVVLGREPELSLAELNVGATKWGGKVSWCSFEVAVVATPKDIEPEALKRLGGSVKMVKVLEEWPNGQMPMDIVKDKLKWQWLQQFWPTGRVEFGVSAYGF